MIKTKIKIINKLGLHARAAMKMVSLAGRFESDIRLRYLDREVDAKDIMNVMVLGASQGAEIEIQISGADEQEAMEKITTLINHRFGEEE
jgi:phosphocarrier protein HPr